MAAPPDPYGRLALNLRTTSTPPGRVLYAIGDMHGRLDLLDPLLDWIAADAESSAGRATLVLLGDYIDRGPASAGVLERLVALEQEAGRETVCLRGNHEQALLDALSDPVTGPPWWRWGGDETLRSYGVPVPAPGAEDGAWHDAVERLGVTLPAAHRELLGRTRLSYAAGDYLFVHAGVRSGTPLAMQSADELMTIRRPFLEASWPGGDQAVVAGHTPLETPMIEAGKIVIDTGAYATGILTAVRLEGVQRQIVQSTHTGIAVSPPTEGWG